MIDADELPALFAEMDGFLLPSHAEGWGLPAMEAMAMELPVAVTDWGGVTHFSSGYSERASTKDPYGRFKGGYAIKVEKLEAAFDNPSKGYWAVPSVPHMKQILRHMYEHQEEAKASGKLGRQKVLKYDRSAVAKDILRSFNEIYTEIVRPSTTGLSKSSSRASSPKSKGI